jgi:hypothetical protein
MQPAAKPDDSNYFRGDGADRSFYLPRLPREYYQGDAVVHWTLPVASRGRGWLNETSHAPFARSCFTPRRAKAWLVPLTA